MNEQQRKTLELLNVSTVPDLNLIIPRGTLPETLKAEIASADGVKLLVAGQRGMGKTTELRRLVDLLTSENAYLPIFVPFGSQEAITETALILTMANHLFSSKEAGLTASAIRELEEWQTAVEIGETLEEAKEGSAAIGGSIPLLKGKLGVSHKAGSSVSKTRQIVKPKSELLEAFNRLLGRAREKCKKRVVFVMDDIDKVQNPSSIEKTFIHAAQFIGDIDCPCVFTVPITYATSTYLRIATLPYNALYRMPAVSLFDSNGQRDEDAFKFMHAVFGKRMLFNPLSEVQLNRVLEYSGGVLVDAMRMLRGITKQAILNKTASISDEVVDQHFQMLVDDYKFVFDTPQLWKRLAKFCNTADKNVYITDETIPDLLYKMIVIEYRDSKMWFNIHPAARRLYEQNKQSIDQRIAE